MLSKEDSNALRKSHSDLSDIDEGKKGEVLQGFAAAYDAANRVTAGLANPLTVENGGVR